ncbi:MAG: hypothetical protein ACYDA3_04875 [Gaiellaceae bacterium]
MRGRTRPRTRSCALLDDRTVPALNYVSALLVVAIVVLVAFKP